MSVVTCTFIVLQIVVQCSDGQVKEGSDFRASFMYHNGNDAFVGSYPVGQPTSDGTGFTCHRKTITDVQIFSGDVYGEPVILYQHRQLLKLSYSHGFYIFICRSLIYVIVTLTGSTCGLAPMDLFN